MAESGSNLNSFARNFTSIYSGYKEQMVEKNRTEKFDKIQGLHKNIFNQIIHSLNGLCN